MIVKPLTPKTFSSIGRMVYKTHPDLAHSIVNLLEKAKPEVTDLKYIKQFYTIFCELNQIKKFPKGIRGTYLKHVFIGSIIKVCNPEILTGIHSTNVKWKLRKHLSKYCNLLDPNTSRAISVVTARLRFNLYEDFTHDVEITSDAFKMHFRNVSK